MPRASCRSRRRCPGRGRPRQPLPEQARAEQQRRSLRPCPCGSPTSAAAGRPASQALRRDVRSASPPAAAEGPQAGRGSCPPASGSPPRAHASAAFRIVALVAASHVPAWPARQRPVESSAGRKPGRPRRPWPTLPSEPVRGSGQAARKAVRAPSVQSAACPERAAASPARVARPPAVPALPALPALPVGTRRARLRRSHPAAHRSGRDRRGHVRPRAPRLLCAAPRGRSTRARSRA
jgi:hypothetical protein